MFATNRHKVSWFLRLAIPGMVRQIRGEAQCSIYVDVYLVYKLFFMSSRQRISIDALWGHLRVYQTPQRARGGGKERADSW